jgi:uncharacterized protein YegP (UPF0339 family)
MNDNTDGEYIMYFDTTRKARWLFKSGDGRIIADSGESYDDIGACSRDIKLMRKSSDAPCKISGLMKRRGRPVRRRKARATT